MNYESGIFRVRELREADANSLFNCIQAQAVQQNTYRHCPTIQLKPRSRKLKNGDNSIQKMLPKFVCMVLQRVQMILCSVWLFSYLMSNMLKFTLVYQINLVIKVSQQSYAALVCNT